MENLFKMARAARQNELFFNQALKVSLRPQTLSLSLSLSLLLLLHLLTPHFFHIFVFFFFIQKSSGSNKSALAAGKIANKVLKLVGKLPPNFVLFPPLISPCLHKNLMTDFLNLKNWVTVGEIQVIEVSFVFFCLKKMYQSQNFAS
jgi:hypothetical protein